MGNGPPFPHPAISPPSRLAQERVSARLTVEEPAGAISGLDCQADVEVARRLSETGGLAAATDGGQALGQRRQQVPLRVGRHLPEHGRRVSSLVVLEDEQVVKNEGLSRKELEQQKEARRFEPVFEPNVHLRAVHRLIFSKRNVFLSDGGDFL